MHPAVRIDELTGLRMEPDPDYKEFIVVIGYLAYSTHRSHAAAIAWMRWNWTPEQRAMAHIEEF